MSGIEEENEFAIQQSFYDTANWGPLPDLFPELNQDFFTQDLDSSLHLEPIDWDQFVVDLSPASVAPAPVAPAPVAPVVSMPHLGDPGFWAQLAAASPPQWGTQPTHSTNGNGGGGGDSIPEPGKRSRGRPKKAEGAPKGPYKKRGAPAPPRIGPVRTKRAYRKRIAAPADVSTIRVATAATVREGVKVAGWYTTTGDGLYKGPRPPPNGGS
ncbi:hypothetical protein MMC22_004545 [Lobaria immixta]|nr:hypothetical protein [Lobaria immixta]